MVKRMLPVETAVGILVTLFIALTAIGIILPESRELMAGKVVEFAVGLFTAILVLLRVERGATPPPDASPSTPPAAPTASPTPDQDEGGRNGSQ